MKLNRIYSEFGKLVGKSVARIGWGGQFMWMVFDDGTYIFLDAHAHAMSYESEPSDYWSVEIGLISREKYEADEAAKDQKRAAYVEAEERKQLAALKAKYPEETP